MGKGYDFQTDHLTRSLLVFVLLSRVIDIHFALIENVRYIVDSLISKSTLILLTVLEHQLIIDIIILLAALAAAFFISVTVIRETNADSGPPISWRQPW